MRKLVLLSFVIVASLQFCGAQSLDKMQWFNEPEQWEITVSYTHLTLPTIA